MTMPINLVLVRHGESEGNIANHRSRHGDHSDYTPEFLHRHSSSWRLTDKGITQAQQAGKWIRENIGSTFQRYYVSEYLRAKETAALLDLPNARWYTEFYLRERDWGALENISHEQKMAEYHEVLARKKIDGIYWKPPHGESMADLCLRIDRIIATLHRECSDGSVIIVCHGEVMWAFLLRLLRLTMRQYAELDKSTDRYDRIHNCQVLQFTRVNPQDSTDVRKYLYWWRSVCPWQTVRSRNNWEEIYRPRHSNEDLLTEVQLTPRAIS